MRLLGGLLISMSIIWALIVFGIYSDSLMAEDRAMWYFFACLFFIGVGIFCIILPKKKKSN
jgi:predicted membrane channel-forming protein YqfA (hemolysin III family)